MNLRCGGDSTVILYFGISAREVRILDFSKVEVVQVGTVNIKQPAYPTCLVLSAETAYNSKDYVTVALKDEKGMLFCGRKVIVDFNGVKTFQTDNNGQIKVPTEGLAPGVYKLHITFNDSVSFGKSEFYADITVKKAATNIISSALITVYNEDGYLKATLKDENNQVLVGLNVTAVINGKTINLTTDSLGAVKLSAKNLVPKTYTASISFAGDGNYVKSTKSVKVTVKKATPKFVAKAKAFKLTDKTKKYVVTFKNNKNKAIKSKRVYIKVAGITYSAKTNAKGQATFKLTKLKKAGSFNAGLTFKGDAYYNKCSKSVKIVVKK